MKKFIFVLLAIVMFAVPAFGQSLSDEVLDAGLFKIATGTEWVMVDAIPTDYTDATTAYPTGAMIAGTGAITAPASVAALQADSCAGGDDYQLADYAGTGGGRALYLCDENATFTDDLASGSATALYICSIDGSAVLGCTDINSGAGQSISDGDTITYDGNAWFVLADIVDAP